MGAPFISRHLRNDMGKQQFIPPTKSAAFWIKSAQALLLAVAVCFSIGASDNGSRFNDLNHRLMCTCGCAQVLGECNHVGCPSRGTELAELSAAIANRRHRRSDSLQLRGQIWRHRAGRSHHTGLRPGRLGRALRRLRRGAAGNHPAGASMVHRQNTNRHAGCRPGDGCIARESPPRNRRGHRRRLLTYD